MSVTIQGDVAQVRRELTDALSTARETAQEALDAAEAVPYPEGSTLVYNLLDEALRDVEAAQEEWAKISR